RDRRTVAQRSSSYVKPPVRHRARREPRGGGPRSPADWSRSAKGRNMRRLTSFASVALTSLAAATAVTCTASAQQPRPNIVLIMGDDIGWFNVGAYHQGIMAGRTPKLDRLAGGRPPLPPHHPPARHTAGGRPPP